MNNRHNTNLFVFYTSEEFPFGAVKITKENALKLKELGWVVNFHADYYVNFIGCKFKDISRFLHKIEKYFE